MSATPEHPTAPDARGAHSLNRLVGLLPRAFEECFERVSQRVSHWGRQRCWGLRVNLHAKKVLVYWIGCVVVSHASGHEIHKPTLANILLDGRTQIAHFLSSGIPKRLNLGLIVWDSSTNNSYVASELVEPSVSAVPQGGKIATDKPQYKSNKRCHVLYLSVLTFIFGFLATYLPCMYQTLRPNARGQAQTPTATTKARKRKGAAAVACTELLGIVLECVSEMAIEADAVKSRWVFQSRIYRLQVRYLLLKVRFRVSLLLLEARYHSTVCSIRLRQLFIQVRIRCLKRGYLAPDEGNLASYFRYARSAINHPVQIIKVFLECSHNYLCSAMPNDKVSSGD
jgi:hypothetical protein